LKRMAWLLAALLCAAALAALARSALKPSSASVEQASLGMMLIDIADEQSATSYHVDTPGVYVLMVEEQSPAFRAGVRSGDRLVSVNGIPMGSTVDFIALQEKFVHQQRIRVDFHRGQGTLPLEAELVWYESGMERH